MDGKLGVSVVTLVVELRDSGVCHASSPDSMEDPDTLSALMASSPALPSSFAFTFFLNFDLLF